MELPRAIEILEKHNAWRRDGEGGMQNSTELGEAIEIVLKVAKEHCTLWLVIKQIAEMPRKTREQRLANSCVKFLEGMK